MPFRVQPDKMVMGSTCPSCGGTLELVDGYRSKAHLVAKCLRCKTGVALPSKFIGKCVLYKELIEESEVAGYIGPKCQNCQFYNESMNPRLNPVLLKRCPKLDLTYKPERVEVEIFFKRFRDVDPTEDLADALKRLNTGQTKWPTIA